MRAEGLGPAKIARQLGVARSSVYRMLEAPGLEVAWGALPVLSVLASALGRVTIAPAPR
jgi:hypothetical protein